MITEVKGSTVVVFWEAKIKLTEDVSNMGSWNVAGWREVLAKLNGKPVNTIQDLVG